MFEEAIRLNRKESFWLYQARWLKWFFQEHLLPQKNSMLLNPLSGNAKNALVKVVDFLEVQSFSVRV